MKILVCNVGSTSLKFKLYEMPEKKIYATAKVERVGSESEAIYSFTNVATGEKIEKDHLAIPRYKDGIELFLSDLLDKKQAILDDIKEVSAVGFKTVLAKGYHGVFELDDTVLGAMKDYLFIAPAHNRPYLDAIGEFRAMLPDALLVGSFETAFHKTVPMERRLYAIPYEWYEKYGIQRFGFHGNSHEYVARHLAELNGVSEFKAVSCHLGGSSSLCAIKDGKSVDCSFGFTPQTGLPHAARVGDIDAYVVPFLMNEGLSMDEILGGFAKKGGLLGISGVDSDLRFIEEAANGGNERAKLAMNMLVESIVKYIGSYYVEMGGLDYISFAGGIGENSKTIRRMVCEKLEVLGVKLDSEKNENAKGECELSAKDSKVKIYVIATDEEQMVAMKTYEYSLSK
ncbi:MAG: acetate/propionate family kinase [Clostridia bacterium]|nr:acetate/propionate family kinase [Clostridia bacterium]